MALFSTSVKKPTRLTGSRRDWMDRHINDPFVKAAKLVRKLLFSFTLSKPTDLEQLSSSRRWMKNTSYLGQACML